jgi:hypothetical protein
MRPAPPTETAAAAETAAAMKSGPAMEPATPDVNPSSPKRRAAKAVRRKTSRGKPVSSAPKSRTKPPVRSQPCSAIIRSPPPRRRVPRPAVRGRVQVNVRLGIDGIRTRSRGDPHPSVIRLIDPLSLSRGSRSLWRRGGRQRLRRCRRGLRRGRCGRSSGLRSLHGRRRKRRDFVDLLRDLRLRRRRRARLFLSARGGRGNESTGQYPQTTQDTCFHDDDLTSLNVSTLWAVAKTVGIRCNSPCAACAAETKPLKMPRRTGRHGTECRPLRRDSQAIYCRVAERA